MMRSSPFDHEQDHELGRALKSVLSGRDDAAFASRVVARAAELQGRPSMGVEWWEVLSAWARPGLAAATVALAAAVTVWLTGASGVQETNGVLSDPLLQATDDNQVQAAFLATQPPDVSEVLALAFGNQEP